MIDITNNPSNRSITASTYFRYYLNIKDVALSNEESSILEEIQCYRKNDNTIDLHTKFEHDPRPTWVPLVDLFERHPRAVDYFMREVGLDLKDYLPEVALSGSEESINTLEEEDDNDTEDTDEDDDISQENEFQNPHPHTNIHTETSSMTPFPARRSTRLRNPPCDSPVARMPIPAPTTHGFHQI
jgi:hypothetical protein